MKYFIKLILGDRILMVIVSRVYSFTALTSHRGHSSLGYSPIGRIVLRLGEPMCFISYTRQ